MDLGAEDPSLQSAPTDSGDAAVIVTPKAASIWQGASGRRFAHTVYSLIGCPPLVSATYLLVYRNPDGRRLVLTVARTHYRSATLNLAIVRHLGACLGANEVHVNVAETSSMALAETERDLSAALLA